MVLAECADVQGLREWPAFIDCKKTIDTFLLGLPLLQSLAHKSMRPRHWSEVMRITGTTLNTAEDVMKLQHLLDAQLVDHQEEVGPRRPYSWLLLCLALLCGCVPACACAVGREFVIHAGTECWLSVAGSSGGGCDWQCC